MKNRSDLLKGVACCLATSLVVGSAGGYSIYLMNQSVVRENERLAERIYAVERDIAAIKEETKWLLDENLRLDELVAGERAWRKQEQKRLERELAKARALAKRVAPQLVSAPAPVAPTTQIAKLVGRANGHCAYDFGGRKLAIDINNQACPAAVEINPATGEWRGL